MTVFPQGALRPILLRQFLYLACILMLVRTPGVVAAYGLPIATAISSEQALLIVNGSQQQLITSITLDQTNPNAAVIFPVPGTPSVDQPSDGAALLAYLNQATAPQVESERRYVWRLPAESVPPTPTPSAVTLLNQQALGNLEISSLTANDPLALQRWLDQHHYDIPPSAQAILTAYSRAGWAFVAVRLTSANPNERIAPIRISYSASELVYPMRFGTLASNPIDLDLFVISDHRTSIATLPTIFAGPIASLDPPPSAEIATLLTPTAYLTRMQAADINPTTLTTDLQIDQAPNDETYRAVISIQETISFAEEYALLSIFLCLAAFSPISFVIALSIRRRIQFLVPDPDQKD